MRTTTVNYHGAELEVHYDYFAGMRGSRELCGRQLEPDEPAGAEVLSVYVGNEDVTMILSGEQIEEIGTLVMQQLRYEHEED